MDVFRGMKLARKEESKTVAVNIAVKFDKSKHLSDASIKRRKIVRDRLIAKDRAKEEEEKKKQREIDEKKEKER
jgi:arginine/serine-rich splicing factor 17